VRGVKMPIVGPEQHPENRKLFAVKGCWAHCTDVHVVDGIMMVAKHYT